MRSRVGRLVTSARNWMYDNLHPGCGRVGNHYDPRPLVTNPINTSDTDLGGGALPRISIVVPSYNQARFIGDTLESIVQQHYPNLELIVIDGASTDGSQAVIERYLEYIAHYVSEPDKGQTDAINKGMDFASGDILAWLNSDDCLVPGTLFHIVATFRKEPRVDVIYGHRILIDEQGRDIGRWVLPGHNEFLLSYADFVPQETMYWKRELWNKIGGHLDHSFQFAMDWDLIAKFIEAGAHFKLTPMFLGQFRLHSSQKTQKSISNLGAEEMERIRERYLNRKGNNRLHRKIVFRIQRMSLYIFLARARLEELKPKYN